MQPRVRDLQQSEITLWTTLEEHPRALQASECSELLDPTRANYMILAQRQPGKFTKIFRAANFKKFAQQRSVYSA